MSGMHLLPIYYTTTVHSRKRKKSRKVSKSMQEAQRKHDKFLKSMGIGTEKKRSVASRSDQKGLPPKTERVSKAFPSENILDKDWSPCPKKPAPINTGNHVIGQAYNKGNYQVLSSSEVKDDMTGKRR